MKLLLYDIPKNITNILIVEILDLYIKLFNTYTKKIEFIGKLDELDEEILNFVNVEKEITANKISDHMGLSVEDTIEKLESLRKYYFIFKKKPVSPEMGKDDLYCSFYNLFVGDE